MRLKSPSFAVGLQGALAAERRAPGAGARALSAPALTVLGLGALIVVAAFIRVRAFSAYYWVDEGLSVGIASHHLSAIPGVLRQDGSPPLYYMLLHFWIAVAGSGERATHALSLLFALLTIPAGFWAGRSLFGVRCGWICAALAAFNPFITAYAQETRMYALVVLLSMLASAAFIHVFAFGRRRHLPLAAITLAALVYTHNWGAFFAIGTLGALIVLARGGDRRALLRDAAIAYGGALLLFAPWIPTLLFQARHTGAPWALDPTWRAAQQIPTTLLGGPVPALITLVFAGGGALWALRRTSRPEHRAVVALIAMLALMVVTAWVFAKLSPGWAGRYFSIFVGPLLIIVAFALARTSRAGLVGLAALVVLWFSFTIQVPDAGFKSNVRTVAHALAHRLRPGDLVLVTHPEEVPTFDAYLPAGMRYATPLGPVPDPRVMDWRDALDRLRAVRVEPTLKPLLDGLPVGARLALVRPIVYPRSQWVAPWTRLVKSLSQRFGDLVAADPRFVAVADYPRPGRRIRAHVRVRATLYVKRKGNV
ncbi:MAG: hypothetical protein NVSMB25_23530 [Thermoleophilaceae bacterium]